MTTTKYILTGGAGTKTHIDLGLQVGNLSFDGQSFEVKGSDGDNSFFLRPAGYSFDFTDNRAGDDKVYLTGDRDDYVTTIADGVATLTRGAGATAETVSVSVLSDNMTLVFADGAVTANALTAGGGEPLDTGLMSVDFTPPADNSGGVRVGTVGPVSQTNIFGLEGLSFAAIGNGRVDEVFVAAGAKVDATKLGLGQDRIYLEGDWEDYAKTLTGNQITLTRTVVSPLDGGATTEEVKVIGGLGASNDRLLFADGSVDTRDMLLALRNDAGIDITTNTDIWDSASTSFSSAPPLEGDNHLTLSLDSGASSDDWVTNDGTVIVSGLTEGFVWQYSTNGGQSWAIGSGSSFTLAGQTSGEDGVEYAAGEVLVRQVNPFGVASSSVSNQQKITVDAFIAEAPASIASALTVIEDAAFDAQGYLTLTGTLTPGVSALSVRWDDGDPLTDEPFVDAVLDTPAPGQWTATFHRDRILEMEEGASLTFSIIATDLAGNIADPVTSGPITLELANEAPQVNAEATIAPQILAAGDIGAAFGGTVILDLTDLNGDLGATPNDTAFTDADNPNSENGTLTYTAEWNGGPLPDWLEMTEAGVLLLVEGATAPALESGEAITFTVTATDGAGETATRTIVIDTLAVPQLTAASDSGASDTDGITNDSTPTLTGNLPDGTTSETPFTLFMNDNPVATESGEVEFDYDNKSWSYTPSSGLLDGDHIFAVKVGDVRSHDLTITIDATAPSALAVEMELDALALDNEDGDGEQGAEFLHDFGTEATIAGWVYISNTDGVTASGSESQTIFGADGDMGVRIAVGGALMLGANGASVNTGLTATEGWRFIAVTRTAEGQSFYLDGVKSSVSFEAGGASPSFLRLGLGSGPGVAPLIDGAYRDLQVWDQALDEAALAAARNGALVDTSDADLAGYWSLAEAGAGAFANAKPGGADLTPLGGASVGAFDDSSGLTGVLTSGANLVVKGAGGEPGVEIAVTASDGAETVTATTIVEADGSWRVALQLEPQTGSDYTITAVQTDIAGNASAASEALVIRARAAPRLDAASDTGVAGDNITFDATPVIIGDLSADYVSGAPFSIYVNGELAATATDETPTDGLSLDLQARTWSYTPETPLDAGENLFQTASGGTFSGTLAVVIAPPAAPDLEDASDSGVSDTDDLTNDATPTLTGALPMGIAVDSVVRILKGDEVVATVSDGGAAEGLTLNLAENSWSYTPPDDLGEGDHTFALEVDGAVSDVLTVTVDLTGEQMSRPSAVGGSLHAMALNNPDSSNGESFVQVSIPDANPMTVMARVYIPETSIGTQSILMLTRPDYQRSGYIFALFESLGEWHAQGLTGVEVTEGWSHIALSIDSHSHYRMYIDGQLLFDQRSNRSDFSDFVARFGVYYLNDNGSNRSLVDGAFNDIQLWGRALSENEIAASSACADVDTEDQDLLGYWPLSDSFDNAVADGPSLTVVGDVDVGLLRGDNGNIGDKTVFVTANQVISGDDAEPGATITVTVNDGTEDTTLLTAADDAGAWSVQLSLDPDTDYTISAVQTDAAGNTSEASPAVTVRVDADLPVTPAQPQLDPASDTGALGDNRTINTTPTLKGALPSNIAQGDEVAIIVNDETVATVTNGTSSNGLVVAYEPPSWSYTPVEPLPPGEYEFVISADGVASWALTVTIVDLTPTITQAPAVVEAAAFDGEGKLELRGDVDADAAVVTVSWAGGPGVDAQIDDETGTWAAVFSKAAMETMTDAAAAHFTVTATDARGNVLGVAQSDDIGISFVNETPVSNDSQAIGLQVVTENEPGAVGGTPILDLTDLGRDGGDTTDDVAFTDADAAGSDHATLRYSLTPASGEDIPAWLEMTQAGVLQVVEGMAPSTLDAPITVTVTATDGDGATASRDIQIGSLPGPDLQAGSDTGASDTDGVTRIARPVLSGDLPAGAEEGTRIAIYRDGEEVAFGAANGEHNGLFLDYDGNSWTYTPPEDLPDGGHVFEVAVEHVRSQSLTVTVDTAVDAPVNLAVAGAPQMLVLNNADTDGTGRAYIDHDFSGGQLTLATWVYVDYLAEETSSNQDRQVIFSTQSEDYRLHFVRNLLLVSGVGHALFEDVTTGWRHIALVVSAEGSEVYLDGVKSSTDTSHVTMPTPSGPITLGGAVSGGDSLIGGAFRDVRVWDRPLDEAEIVAAYGGGPVDLDDPNLVGHWLSDGVSGPANAKDGGVALTKEGGAEFAVYDVAPVAGRPVVSGEAEAGATVTLTISDGATVSTQTAVADADGNWTATLDLAPEQPTDYEISATQADLAGNVSQLSIAATIRVSPTDTPDLLTESDTGVSSSDNITSDTTPTLTGDLPDGFMSDTEIVIFRDGVPVASGSADNGATGGLVIDEASGQWTYAPVDPLLSNEYDFAVSIGGVLSKPLTVIVDVDIAAPTIRTPFNGLVLGNDDGDGADGASLAHAFGADATIAGWVYIGDSDGVTVGGFEVQTIFGAGGGDMEVTIAADGAVMLNAGGAAVDTGFAASKGWHYIAVTRDATGQSFFFNNKKSAADFSALGTAPSSLQLGLGAAAGDRPLIDGAFSRVQLWDRALSEAELGAAYADAAPDITDTDLIGYWPLSETGANAFDNAKTGGPALVALGGAAVGVLSTAANPVMNGVAEAFARIQVTADDGTGAPVAVAAVADAAGAWSVTLPLAPAADVDYNITVTQTDLAGNESVAATGVLRISPSILGAPVLDAASDTGLQGDNITLDAAPVVRGLLPAGYVGGDFVVYLDGVEVARANSETPVGGLVLDLAARSWTYTHPDTAPLTPGVHEFRAGVDGGELAPALTVTIEALEKPDLEDASDSGASSTDDITNNATPALSGRLPVGMSGDNVIELLVNGAAVESGLTLDYNNSSWSYTPSAPLSDGEYEFILRVDGVESEALEVVIDTNINSAAHGFEMQAMALNADSSTDTVMIQGSLGDWSDESFVTVAGWVYVGDLPGQRQQILSVPGAFSMDVLIDAEGYLCLGHVDNKSDIVVTTGWHFLTVVNRVAGGRNDSIKLYWNGDEAYVRDGGDKLIDNQRIDFGSRIRLRYLPGNIEEHYPEDVLIDGAFRDMQVWNRLLSQPEIEAMVNGASVNQDDPNLKHYWPLTTSGADAVGDADLSIEGDEIRFQHFSDTAGFNGPFLLDVDNGVAEISGSGAEPGAVVRVLVKDDDAVIIETAISDSEGRWSVQLSLELGSEYEVSISQEDLAGNVSEQIVKAVITVDAPGAPDLVAEDDSGVLDTDNVTNERRPTLEGVFSADGEGGQPLVEIFKDGVVVATTAPGGDAAGLTVNYAEGSWNYTPPSDLSSGDHAFRASVDNIFSKALTVSIVNEVAGDAFVSHAPFYTVMATDNQAYNDGGGAKLTHDFGQNATVGGWVYIADPKGETTGGDQLIYHTFRDLGLEIQQGTGALEAYINGAWVDTGFVAETGWHYIAVTDAPEAAAVYYNDQVYTYAAQTGSRTGTYLNLGRHNIGDRRAFMGAFRDVQVWDRTLSGEEIEAARNGAVDLEDAALVGYWPMDPSSGFNNVVTGGSALAQHGGGVIEVWSAGFIEPSGEDVVLSGALTADIESIVASWDDGDDQTTDPGVNAVIDREKGTWTATFTPQHMRQMSDGANLDFKMVVTDTAGNTKERAFTDVGLLEATNEAPEATSVQIAAIDLAVGDTVGDGGATLLDLTDLPGGAGAAFVDNDTPGSANATLTYSAVLKNGEAWPDWLEMTPAGLLRIIGGATISDRGDMIVTVTATDGSGESVTRDIAVNTNITLTSIMHGEDSLDVRSDIVVAAEQAGVALALTTTEGTYQVRLVQLTDALSKTGFDGENADGSQSITVTVSDQGVATFDGGEIRIVDGRAVIDFGQDFDLANTFGLETDGDVFVNAQTNNAASAIEAGDVRFSTVTPSAAGTVAKIWDDATSAFVDGDSWYDGTDGDYFGNDVGLSVDLSAVTGVVALGHDGADTSNIVLNAYGRTVLTGFGGDDLLYVDRGVGHVANDLSINEIGVRDNGGNVPTILTFTGASFQAGVLITFADDPSTTGVDERDLVAVAFNAADAGPGEHSFESITGNATPVIGG